jgi:hypothetical protein
MICGNPKIPRGKKLHFFRKKYKNVGLNKFFGHISPILDDASDLLSMEALRTHMALFAKVLTAQAALAAQAVSHSSS